MTAATVARQMRRPRDAVAASISPGGMVLLLVVVWGIAAMSVVVAFAADGLFFRLMMAAWGVLFASVGWYVRVLAQAQPEGAVRVGVSGALAFKPPRLVACLQALVAVLALVPGVLAWVAPSVTGERLWGGQGSIWLTVVTVAAMAWLVQQAIALRLPAGLTVSPAGLTGVRGSKRVDVTWDQIKDVRAVVVGRRSRLVVQAAEGGPVEVDAASIGNDAHVTAALRSITLQVDPTYTGSDPNLVAAVIRYYLEHPDQREALVDGLGALRRYEQSSAA